MKQAHAYASSLGRIRIPDGAQSFAVQRWGLSARLPARGLIPAGHAGSEVAGLPEEYR